MNVTEANTFIRAINTIVEGSTALARAIENTAWESFEDHTGMSGVRTIAAVQLAEPALEAEAEDHEAHHQPPAPTPVPEPEPVTLEQVRTVLARLSQADHTAKVRNLIQSARAAKLSQVNSEKYGAVGAGGGD